MATAKQGFLSTGIELNSVLVVYSKLASLRSGFSKMATFRKRDLWKVDLKQFNNVVIFGVEEMVNKFDFLKKRAFLLLKMYVDNFVFIFLQMAELERKCLKELSKDSCIVACRFPLPNLKPIKTIGVGIDTVWLYII